MRVPVKVAAEILEMAPLTVQLFLRAEKLPIGTATIGSGDRFVYDIRSNKLEEYIGKKINWEKYGLKEK